jgi:hypothetical protein
VEEARRENINLSEKGGMIWEKRQPNTKGKK